MDKRPMKKKKNIFSTDTLEGSNKFAGCETMDGGGKRRSSAKSSQVPSIKIDIDAMKDNETHRANSRGPGIKKTCRS